MDNKPQKQNPSLFPPHGGYKADKSDPYGIAKASSEVAANTLICLINQASYLLGRQLQRLEQQFLNEGGFTEKFYQARQQAKRRS